MPATLAFEPLLSAHEAASLLGIHTNTLFKWAREERLPSIRYGRSVRFRASALNDWLDRRVTGYSDTPSRVASTFEREAA